MPGCDACAPALEYEGVRFSYPGANAPVLDGASLSIEQGAFALLVGDTGSGKSTLLALAKPEIAPAGSLEGSVRVFGRQAADLDVASSAQLVGYVFQNPDNQLVAQSVWHELAFGLENLGFPQDEMRRRVAETCYFLGMDGWFRAETDTLSGGRKQLAALGSVLAMRPRLLLLDEPTAQLDPIAEKSFLHALFRVNREMGCTVVVATHEPRAFVDYATAAYRLRDGAVERVGDMGSLRTLPELLPGRSRSHAAPSRALALERAWFRYDRGSDWVLRNFDLDVARGEVHALVGGNGSGKSTVLALIAGAYRLNRGSCENGLRSSQVLLPQDPRALMTADTVLGELMEWSDGAYGEDGARSMLERMGLSGMEARHPYDLSGGQQQLLALAKLLMVEPSLLLLDEPTKGLDNRARALLARTVDDARAQGRTMVMASHDLDFVRQVADRVTMVFDGEAACTQEAGEFFRDNVYYRP